MSITRGSAREQVEEYVEVTGKGGDFAPMWDFEESPELVGTFAGTVTRDIRGEDRTIHQFTVNGEAFEAWGAAILNSRLEDLDPGTDVKVVSTGKRIPTKRGKPAKEFKVFVKASALKRRS